MLNVFLFLFYIFAATTQEQSYNSFDNLRLLSRKMSRCVFAATCPITLQKSKKTKKGKIKNKTPPL